MTTPQPKKRPAVDPVPKGYTTLTTYLVAQDADGLIDFMKKTFDARGTFRSGPGSEGGLHCEVRIGDSMLMVGGGGPGMKWRGTPHAQRIPHLRSRLRCDLRSRSGSRRDFHP